MEVIYQNNKICRLCGGENLIEEFKNIEDPHNCVDDSFSILHCLKCDFHFTNPIIVNEDLGFLYSGNYFGIENKLSFFEKLYRFDQYRFDFGLYKKYLSTNMKMIDYGCGNGTRIEYLRKEGFDVVGIDEFNLLTTDEVEDSKFIIKNPLNYVPNQKYDVVFMYHVLEHLREFEAHLSNIKNNYLKKGGYLIIQVPNVDCWQFKKYQENYTLFDVPRHFWHFNKQSIKYLFEKNNFAVKNINCQNSLIHPSTVLSSVFKFDIRKEWQKPNPSKLLIHAKFGLFCMLSLPVIAYENLNDNSPVLNCIAQNN